MGDTLVWVKPPRGTIGKGYGSPLIFGATMFGATTPERFKLLGIHSRLLTIRTNTRPLSGAASLRESDK